MTWVGLPPEGSVGAPSEGRGAPPEGSVGAPPEGSVGGPLEASVVVCWFIHRLLYYRLNFTTDLNFIFRLVGISNLSSILNLN